MPHARAHIYARENMIPPDTPDLPTHRPPPDTPDLPTAPARPLQGKARAFAAPAQTDAPRQADRSGTPFAEQKPRRRCACPRRSVITRRPAAFHGTLPPPVRTAAHMSDNTPAAARSAPTRSPGSGAIAHALPASQVVALVVALIIAGLTYRRLLGVPLRFAPGRAAPGSASLRPRAAQAAQNPRPPPRVALRPSASLTPPRSPARCASSACPASLRAPLGKIQCVSEGRRAPHAARASLRPRRVTAPAPPRLSVAARRAAAAARPPLPVLAPARLPVRPPKGGSR